MQQEEWRERQDAELEFVRSAYLPDEAWIDETDNGSVLQRRVYRRFGLEIPASIEDAAEEEDDVLPEAAGLLIVLAVELPVGYPVTKRLHVEAGSIDDSSNASNTAKNLRKGALDALPHLISACRSVAAECLGEESVLLVFNRAEEWIQDDWPSFYLNSVKRSSRRKSKSVVGQDQRAPNSLVLGRRLIYSHHIISKIKRGDIKKLTSELKLTGYMKIGWPGIIIIEGSEEDCVAFYDEIRPWSWQYLVVRGEQQETLSQMMTIDSNRKFQEFLEVEDMSVVAQHCKEVGLEALFRTSMKVYDNGSVHDGSGRPVQQSTSPSCNWYGALVHVDHMNDGKGYRKWLRKTARETDCLLLIKQCYPNDDYSCRRPIIVVGIVGDSADVSGFLKRWRTSRVDVDVSGKPCLERQMSVVSEGQFERQVDLTAIISWDKPMSEDEVKQSGRQVRELLQRVGGTLWSGCIASILF